MSKTKQALAILKSEPDRSVASVADQLKISKRVIYTALKVRRDTAHLRCLTCDQILPYMTHAAQKD